MARILMSASRLCPALFLSALVLDGGVFTGSADATVTAQLLGIRLF